MLDVARIRADFPLLAQRENGHRLVYLDNAATTQKPQVVLEAIVDSYRTTNANVHRGAYDLAIRATEAYEAARAKVAAFVNAWAPEGVVFTRGTTEAINLVAGSYGRATLKAGDSVVVTGMDHHSNLVPWQILCQEKGATLRMVEITEDGRIDLSDFGRALERTPKIVAFPYVSNALGTVNPAAQLAKVAHAVGAVVVVDGAQSTPHLKVDVQALAAAAIEKLIQIEGVTVYGPHALGHRAGVVSFTYGDVHPHDIATILDRDGICIRAGHHCTQPLMRRLNVAATARASFYLYNGSDDVDALAGALVKAGALFGYVPA